MGTAEGDEMGCDIWPQIQVKTSDVTPWRTAAVPADDRCYTFFEALLGVRNAHGYGGALPQRDLPEDLGYGLGWKIVDTLDFGDHSRSWFTLAELVAAAPEAQRWARHVAAEESVMDLWRRWVALATAVATHYKVTNDKVRFVVGFDS